MRREAQPKSETGLDASSKIGFALPRIGAERTRGEPFPVEEIDSFRVRRPGIANRPGPGNLIALHNDGIALNPHAGGNEFLIGTGDFEVAERLSISRLETASDMSEGNSHSSPFSFAAFALVRNFASAVL